MRNSIEGFAMATSWFGKKRYLLGQLPIADAFIAWSHSRVPLEIQMVKPTFWGKPLLFIALLIALFVFWGVRLIRK
ncbi:hypothetical protein [Lewinella sp. LCG006]|uniref:hypothetical protein n=1 Tax=Lewinella sp. LCG006 TaxID=3231911 RepID=UPI003460A1AA